MLRQIMLNKKKREFQELLKTNEEQFAELETREAELEKDIEEAKTEEEKVAVEEEVSKFEEDSEKLKEEKKKLEEELEKIDQELSEIDKKERNSDKKEKKTNEEEFVMRENFGGLTRDKIIELVKRDDVKDFLVRTRKLKEERGVTNADLLIPEVLIGILRDNIYKYSKLINKVYLKKIKGKGRMTIAGSIPEAVWIEAVDSLKELALNFNEFEIDEYKIGGYVPISNSTLEDASDINLFNEIMYALAQAIGLALDKAIIYGTGKKMPLGIVTRLAQTVKPDNYPTKAREWVDLSKKNILKVIGDTSQKLFADLTLKSAAAKPNFSDGNKFWVMSDTTFTTLKSKLVEINAAGALVSSISNVMPLIGGEIIILPFIPDGDVIGGYSSLYVLAERAEIALGMSEHVQFIQDNTVFKGTARYDGAPVVAEGFVALNIENKAPTTTLSFAS